MIHLIRARKYKDYWLDSGTNRVVSGGVKVMIPVLRTIKSLIISVLPRQGIPRELVDVFIWLVRRALFFFSHSS